MKKKEFALLALFLGLTAVAQSARSATLLNWRFDNGTTTINPDDVDRDDNFLTIFDNSFAVGTWTLRDTGAPSDPNAGGTLTMSGGISRATGWNDADSNAYQFLISIAPGVQITFEDGAFYDTVSKEFTPTTWTVSIGGQSFGTGSTHVGFPNNVYDPTDITLGEGIYSVVLAGIGNAGESFAAGATREWSIDQFLLRGTVTGTPTGAPAPVPLPAAAWLLLSGMGGLAAIARRRKASLA